MAEHPLKGLYLTRHYNGQSDPFEVITDKPFDEAVALASKFAGKRYVNGRKDDQEHYMRVRLETEDWLRSNAEALGIDIRKQHPVYFVLTTEPQEDKAKNGMKAVSFPAEQFDLSCCTFTYGDSMGNRNTPDGEAPNPLAGRVMDAKGASDAIKAHGMPGDYISGGRYMEIQIWAHPPDAVLPAAKASTPTAPAVSTRPAVPALT